MKNQGKRQRLYDVKECKEKIVAALEDLKNTEQPGEISGKATKSDVVKSAKSEIEALIKEGYTPKQIANAISRKDIFGIMPKTISQLFAEKNIRVPLKKRRPTRATPPLEIKPPPEPAVSTPNVISHRQNKFEIDEVG